MRGQARREYETKYTAEENYAQMMQIYASVMSPGSPVGAGETNELHAAFR